MEALITDAGIILLQFKTSDVEKLLARMGCHLISQKFCCERWPWLYAPSFCEMWASFPHTDFHTLRRIRMQAINSSCSGDCTTHTPHACHSPYFPPLSWLVIMSWTSELASRLFPKAHTDYAGGLNPDGCSSSYLGCHLCSRNSRTAHETAPALLCLIV